MVIGLRRIPVSMKTKPRTIVGTTAVLSNLNKVSDFADVSKV